VGRLGTGAVALVVTGTAGCGPRGLVFYDVTRTRVEECAIRSNGEFCAEPDQFEPPLIENWGVDARDDGGFLYLAGEAWVLAPLPANADPRVTPRTATRERTVASGDALCSTLTTGVVEFLADDLALTGTYRATTRLDGPPACGATPVGERVVEDLVGSAGTP
jgi:hypothetical protein